jgi:hypothetical protein
MWNIITINLFNKSILTMVKIIKYLWTNALQHHQSTDQKKKKTKTKKQTKSPINWDIKKLYWTNDSTTIALYIGQCIHKGSIIVGWWKYQSMETTKAHNRHLAIANCLRNISRHTIIRKYVHYHISNNKTKYICKCCTHYNGIHISLHISQSFNT